ncbi:MAG: RICIN domain-containing protein, partial [Fibrobacter sp.]|nr:RICIN domain-containing protein [Fibrobacter sp.]
EVTADKPAYFEAEWVRVWKAKPTTPDTVRFMSLAAGKCMMPDDEGKLVLGDCDSPSAVALLTPLSTNQYRIGFGTEGEKVVEIPNEKTDAGVQAGVYSWNGKNHQKINFEIQTDHESKVVRMKMVHSNHYLRSSSDGTIVVQDWNDSWPWNQRWRILGKDEHVDSPDTSVADTSVKDSGITFIMKNPAQRIFQNRPVIRRDGNILYVEIPDGSGNVRKMDFLGNMVK